MRGFRLSTDGLMDVLLESCSLQRYIDGSVLNYFGLHNADLDVHFHRYFLSEPKQFNRSRHMATLSKFKTST